MADWKTIKCSECDNELTLDDADKDDVEQALDDEEWVCLNLDAPEDAQEFLCPDCREAQPAGDND